MEETKRIQTEVGTNEWQVVVFLLGSQFFAINVDKTREILRWPGVRPVPQSHPAMLGITTIRGDVVPLIDLRIYLGIQPGTEEEQSKLIVAEFNRMKLGFIVDAVDRIYRINSDELDASLTGTFLGENALYVIKRDGRNILLLDYERIVQIVNPSVAERFHPDREKMAKIGQMIEHPEAYHILVAEDSPLIRRQIHAALTEGGFTNIEMVENGRLALERVFSGDHYDLLVTDVEMPQMDGLALTRRIKESSDHKGLPIIVFSSIMADDISRKASSVGADMQITKPEIHMLLEHVVELLLRKKEEAQKNATQPAAKEKSVVKA